MNLEEKKSAAEKDGICYVLSIGRGILEMRAASSRLAMQSARELVIQIQPMTSHPGSPTTPPLA